MEGTKYTTKEAVLKKGKEAKFKTFGEIDKYQRSPTTKGYCGWVIEESLFNYHPNNNSEPDFPEARVELKVFPFRITKKGKISAKERLVCNIIDYEEEAKKIEFEDSSFWHKCETMLLMPYEYKKDESKDQYIIYDAILFTIPDEDLVIIKRDWDIIMEKIRKGQADLISESDTMYLAACTKGANKSSTRKQPFSDTEAMQRAYSLKSGYMTQVLRKYVFGDNECFSIIKDWHRLESRSFEDIVTGDFKLYKGKTIKELFILFSKDNANSNLKLLISLFKIRYMLINYNCERRELQNYNDFKRKVFDDFPCPNEFQKANIIPLLVYKLNDNDVYIRCFPPIVLEFEILKNKPYFDSDDNIDIIDDVFWERFNSLKFMLCIFKQDEDENLYFDDVNFYSIPTNELSDMKYEWNNSIKDIFDHIKDDKYDWSNCHTVLDYRKQNLLLMIINECKYSYNNELFYIRQDLRFNMCYLSKLIKKDIFGQEKL